MNTIQVIRYEGPPNPPEDTIPSNADTPCRIYYLNKKQMNRFIDIINDRHQYVESIKTYLDATALKNITGVPFNTITEVYVDEDPRTRQHPNRLIPYCASYQREWGNQPLFGNVFIYLSKKGWDALPAEKKLSDAEIDALKLQPS